MLTNENGAEEIASLNDIGSLMSNISYNINHKTLREMRDDGVAGRFRRGGPGLTRWQRKSPIFCSKKPTAPRKAKPAHFGGYVDQRAARSDRPRARNHSEDRKQRLRLGKYFLKPYPSFLRRAGKTARRFLFGEAKR